MNRNDIHAVLTEMDAEGRLSADAVVREAADPSSPLHDYFEWDESEAAHKYREAQARALIRSFRITVTVHSVDLQVPAFVRDPARTAGYTSTVRIRGDTDRTRDLLVMEFDRARAAVSRAKTLAAALNVSGEFDALEREIAAVQASAVERLGVADAA